MSSEATYTGRRHLMQSFIQVQQGDSMRQAGPHLPVVMQDGKVVPLA